MTRPGCRRWIACVAVGLFGLTGCTGTLFTHQVTINSLYFIYLPFLLVIRMLSCFPPADEVIKHTFQLWFRVQVSVGS